MTFRFFLFCTLFTFIIHPGNTIYSAENHQSFVSEKIVYGISWAYWTKLALDYYHQKKMAHCTRQLQHELESAVTNGAQRYYDESYLHVQIHQQQESISYQTFINEFFTWIHFVLNDLYEQYPRELHFYINITKNMLHQYQHDLLAHVLAYPPLGNITAQQELSYITHIETVVLKKLREICSLNAPNNEYIPLQNTILSQVDIATAISIATISYYCMSSLINPFLAFKAGRTTFAIAWDAWDN